MNHQVYPLFFSMLLKTGCFGIVCDCGTQCQSTSKLKRNNFHRYFVCTDDYRAFHPACSCMSAASGNCCYLVLICENSKCWIKDADRDGFSPYMTMKCCGKTWLHALSNNLPWLHNRCKFWSQVYVRWTFSVVSIQRNEAGWKKSLKWSIFIGWNSE